jgi:hypothetical protein
MYVLNLEYLTNGDLGWHLIYGNMVVHSCQSY